MHIDISKSALENLILQMVVDNGVLDIAPEQLTVGVPAVYIDPTESRNTTVTLTAVPDHGWTGFKQIYYTRLDLDSGTELPVTQVQITGNNTQASVKTRVAMAMGLVGDELDVLEFTKPLVSAPGLITLQPVENSLLYIGGPRTIVVTLQELSLPEAIQVVDLSGFSPA